MVLTIALPLVALVIVTFLVYREERSTSKAPDLFVSLGDGMLACSVVALFLLFVQLVVVGLLARSEKTVFSSHEIVSMKDTTGVSGSFILASGSFGENWEYVLYERLEDEAIVQRRLPVERVRIYEAEDAIPRIENHGVVKSCDYLPKWILIGLTICGRTELKGLEYWIFVPPGSVVTGVELDLNK